MAVRRLSAIMLAMASASPAIAQQCDFMATTGDEQFTATNIRAAPSSSAKILMTLEAMAPVEVHVTRQQGNWYTIDRIINSEEDKELFRGAAWIHRSQLVLSVAGGDHRLYKRPTKASPAVMRLTVDGNMLDIVGCRGRWVEVIADKKVRGWMPPEAQCSNPMTTCS